MTIDRSDLIEAAVQAMANVHDMDTRWEDYAEAVIKALCVEEMYVALKPVRAFAETDWRGTAWEGADDDVDVLFHHMTGTTLTVGDFRSASAVLSRFESSFSPPAKTEA